MSKATHTYPKVSVVLPFYNAEATLERAVESIQSQTFQNFELILVNNNSTDQSVQIAQKLSTSDARIQLLHERQQGVTFAANTGNNAASGEYIARMDADDFSLPERLEKQTRFLDRSPQTGVVSCLVKHIDPTMKSGGIKKYVEWVNSLDTPQAIKQNRFIEMPLINPSVMFRRQLLKKHGGYVHGNFPEDYEMWLRWLGNGVVIDKIPQVLFHWHDSDSRLTRTDPRYSTDAFYRTKAEHLSKWLLNNNHPYLWVWGAGRKSRMRVSHLMDKGVFIEGYIDLKTRELEDSCCIHYNDFNWNAPAFILSYVGNHGAREKIRAFLHSKGKIEGKDFLLVA